MKCTCGSTQTTKGDKIGDTYCADCGNVLDDYEIVSELQFENNKLMGNFVNKEGGVNFFIKNQYGYYSNSNEHRLNNAYKEISNIAYILNIEEKIIEQAKRMYQDASTRKFVQGRKIKNVAGALLYAVCRQKQLKYLLIDFSEALGTNLFVLGSIYLKYIRLFGYKVDLVDPSWYIGRYCSKIGFGDRLKTKAVSEAAMK